MFTVWREELKALDPADDTTHRRRVFRVALQIDPLYFDRTYYVAPRESVAGAKAYRAFRHRASRISSRVSILPHLYHHEQHLACCARRTAAVC